ncbi:HET-domain-containing protein [Rhizodiscina lignyota]|uniref:HET-domain-containing protein n=1 Tax=Rhizodiscina lignyota TaxID=1504668 RepID=A0A9P4IUW8_9PEZI|nr:HET-domain-containing protein [Rhizodiscina lignyota]
MSPISTEDLQAKEHGTAESGLCNYCMDIDLDKLEKGYCYGPTLHEVLRTCRDCRFCKAILDAVAVDRDGNHKALAEWVKGRRVFLQGVVLDGVLDRAAQPRYSSVAAERERRTKLGEAHPPARLTCIIVSLDRTAAGNYHASEASGSAVYTGVLRVFATKGTHSISVLFPAKTDDKRADSPPAAKSRLPGRPIVPPNSQLAFKRGRAWLKNCMENHLSCRLALSGAKIDDSSRPALLPTRVIDVGTEPGARPLLFISSGERRPYVTLSYCWGSALSDPTKKALRTTRDTLGQFREEIPGNSLPQTVQDAILVTQNLGMRYLWVDALCIVQDDPDDWRRESQNMGRIFQNAVCTIAATSAQSSDEGLFHRPDPDIFAAPAGACGENFLRIPCNEKGRRIGDIGVSGIACPEPPMSLSGFNKELEISKWYHRGWVVQESLLSRRIIHFAHQKLYFECQHGLYPETSSHEILGDTGVHSKRAIFDRLNRETTLANSLTASSRQLRSLRAIAYLTWDKLKDATGIGIGTPVVEAQYRFWNRVVSRYNVADLTEESDKLIAILGLAKLFEARTRLTYCAGLWIEDIARYLFWYASSDDLRRQPASGGIATVS